jgi:entry exclusion lipoprotein TrbK
MGVMSMKNIAITLVILAILSGCEDAPPPFDVKAVNCDDKAAIEAIKLPENKAAAKTHCANLKLTETRFKKSKDKEWSL